MPQPLTPTTLQPPWNPDQPSFLPAVYLTQATTRDSLTHQHKRMPGHLKQRQRILKQQT